MIFAVYTMIIAERVVAFVIGGILVVAKYTQEGG
jgi:hypothetical protein